MSRVRQGIDNIIVEYEPEMVTIRPTDGQPMVGNSYIVDERTWGEMVSGYRCAWCLHAQSTAFPEECEFTVEFQGITKRCSDFGPHPRGKMREHQLEFLAAEMKARADFNPPDPYDVIDVEQEDWKPTKTGIMVPGRPDA